MAVLLPERVRGLISSGNGYNIQNIAASDEPMSSGTEYRYWYRYYFQTQRGRTGLVANRGALPRLLWRLWSPTWGFDDDTFDRSAAAFDNPDFVGVVIHSYRHRYAAVPGEPALDPIEERLAAQPGIVVPGVVLPGADGRADAPEAIDHDASHFSGPYAYRLIPGAGKNLPHESPAPYADAVLSVA